MNLHFFRFSFFLSTKIRMGGGGKSSSVQAGHFYWNFQHLTEEEKRSNEEDSACPTF